MRISKYILLTTVFLSFTAYAADEVVVPAIPDSASAGDIIIENEDKLPEVITSPVKLAANAAEKKEAPKATTDKDKKSKVVVQKENKDSDKGDSKLFELQLENELLKQRSKISEAIAESTQKPSRANFIGADTVYDYRDGGVYRVYGGKNDITDIALQPGEVLTSEPVAGDTVRWVMATTKSGTTPNEIVHIIIKPTQENISTTFMISTNRHVYKLKAQAVSDWHQPGIRWNYPQEEADKLAIQMEAAKKEDMKVQEISVSPEKIDWNYNISGDEVEWKPVRVYNDGIKTYMQMPDSMATNEAPAFFVLDEDGNNMLVNYRVKNGVYIVDRLFEQGVLKVGINQEVKIVREKPKSNWFSAADTYPRTGVGK